MSAAKEYAELLKLIEITGPFISLPVYKEVFPQGLVKDVPPENTTRGRSFLFFALGVFAGTGLAKPFVLRVPEKLDPAAQVLIDFPGHPLR